MHLERNSKEYVHDYKKSNRESSRRFVEGQSSASKQVCLERAFERTKKCPVVFFYCARGVDKGEVRETEIRKGVREVLRETLARFLPSAIYWYIVLQRQQAKSLTERRIAEGGPTRWTRTSVLSAGVFSLERESTFHQTPMARTNKEIRRS